MKKKGYLLWFACLYAFLIFCHLLYPRWQNSGTEATIGWDVSGYYFYLPSLYYDDLKKLNNAPEIMERYHPTSDFYQAFPLENGNYCMKYASGLAVQYYPAFLAAHFLAKTLGYRQDGFSKPYQMAISFWSLFVGFIGLFVLFKLLCKYFDERVAFLSITLLALGSNYLNYIAYDGAMSHNYLFTIYACILYFTDKWTYSRKNIHLFIIGLLCGLATLTRPTEIISLLLPFIYLVSSKNEFLSRLRHFLQLKNGSALILFATAFGVFSIQIIYWKYVSGNWFVYSYGNQGFDWLKPHIFNCLLSFKKGWWIYSPVMFIACLGFWQLFKYKKLFFGIAVFSLLATYITFSWSEWWYGGSLGQRAMVQYYVFFSFPLAALCSFIFKQSNGKKAAFFGLMILLSLLNFKFTAQAHHIWGYGGMDPENMNRDYFMKVLLQKNTTDVDRKLMDRIAEIPESELKELTLYQRFLSEDTLSLKPNLTNEFHFSPEDNASYYRIAFDVNCVKKESNFWSWPQAVATLYNAKGKKIQSYMLRIPRVVPENEWSKQYFDIKMPTLKKCTLIVFDFYIPEGDQETLISKVVVYKTKN